MSSMRLRYVSAWKLVLIANVILSLVALLVARLHAYWTL